VQGVERVVNFQNTQKTQWSSIPETQNIRTSEHQNIRTSEHQISRYTRIIF
jgi:hypothetical protein